MLFRSEQQLKPFRVIGEFDLTSTDGSKTGGGLEILVGAVNHKDAIRMAIWRSMEIYWNKPVEHTIGKYIIEEVEEHNDLDSAINDVSRFLPSTRLTVPKDYTYHTKPIPHSIEIDTSSLGDFYIPLLESQQVPS